MSSLTYRDAGVDIDAGDALVDRIKPFAKRTMRPEVLGGIGGFGALFEISKKFKEPVLVSGTDGVGTKLKLAFQLNKHDTVGQDLVAMSVNDILVQGAEPLFFLDYFACGKLDVDTAARVVGGIAREIAAAAEEIKSGAENLSLRTEEQASSLEETAATTEQLAASVKASANASRQAVHLAENATRVARNGGAIVTDAIGAMNRIEQASGKITDITSVIDGIAFQTNLLALNAAVEAARAGDAGKGFAVVASEVRALAQQSADAAKSISGLINDTTQEVAAGVKLVRSAGEVLGEIVEATQQVAGTVTEAAAASGEQSNGIDEMSQTVVRMDEMTQQNAALAEESAAAAVMLGRKIAELDALVATFRTTSSARPMHRPEAATTLRRAS